MGLLNEKEPEGLEGALPKPEVLSPNLKTKLGTLLPSPPFLFRDDLLPLYMNTLEKQ